MVRVPGPLFFNWCLLKGLTIACRVFERARIQGFLTDSPVHHEAWDRRGFGVTVSY